MKDCCSESRERNFGETGPEHGLHALFAYPGTEGAAGSGVRVACQRSMHYLRMACWATYPISPDPASGRSDDSTDPEAAASQPYTHASMHARKQWLLVSLQPPHMVCHSCVASVACAVCFHRRVRRVYLARGPSLREPASIPAANRQIIKDLRHLATRPQAGLRNARPQRHCSLKRGASLLCILRIHGSSAYVLSSNGVHSVHTSRLLVDSAACTHELLLPLRMLHESGDRQAHGCEVSTLFVSISLSRCYLAGAPILNADACLVWPRILHRTINSFACSRFVSSSNELVTRPAGQNLLFTVRFGHLSALVQGLVRLPAACVHVATRASHAAAQCLGLPG